MKLDLSVNNLQKYTNIDYDPFRDEVMQTILNMKENDFKILCKFISNLIKEKEAALRKEIINSLNIYDQELVEKFLNAKFTRSYINDNHIVRFIKKIEPKALAPDSRECRLLLETGLVNKERLELLMNRFIGAKTKVIADIYTQDNIDIFLDKVNELEIEVFTAIDTYNIQQTSKLDAFVHSPVFDRISEILNNRLDNRVLIFSYTYESQSSGKIVTENCYLTPDHDFPFYIENDLTKKREYILSVSCVNLFTHETEGQFDDVTAVILSQLLKHL